MTVTNSNNIFISQLRILFCIVLFEYLLFIFAGVSFSFLNGDSFFSIGADPVSWIVFGAGLPQFIAANHWSGLFFDTLIILLFFLFIHNPFKNRLALLLLVLLFIFYITLTGYLTHRNFQVGFFMVFIPFVFKKEKNRFLAFEATRYFLLLFYFSAAFLKFSNNSLSDPTHFSHLLSTQFTPYFLEKNYGMRTYLNLYLVSHAWIAYVLYFASFIIELLAIIGFFTKRFDKWLALLFLAFHFASWLIMDIAPFGQLGFLCLLFLSKSFQPGFSNTD